ncbi:MAG: GNAT family N-acetyltransferase [Acidobacteria bacterium]|nr:GNAT family N-acetyltransferase [Acidobacteriota bacterium]
MTDHDGVDQVITMAWRAQEDLPFLRRCFLGAMRDSITACFGDWDEARELAKFDAQLAIQGTTVLVRNGADVGFVMLTETPDSIQIHTICVSAEYQGHGVGTEAIHAVLARANRAGCNIILSVLKSNGRAEALYRRLGFSVVADSVHHRHLRYTGSKARVAGSGLRAVETPTIGQT